MVGNSITLGLIVLFILFFPKLFIGLIATLIAFMLGISI